VVGRRHGALEREADSLAARALGGRPLGRREPSAMPPVARPGGQPLEGHTREFFESRFGHDFGRVRVHAGDAAAATAGELDAEAFTFGRDVFVRDARDASLGAGDPRILAHELAHVVQVGEGRAPASLVQRKVDPHGRPGPRQYAGTFREYLEYLHATKGGKPVPGPNPYVTPTFEDILAEMNASADFRDQVAAAYEDTFHRDIVDDIVRFATEEEKDRLLRPFVSGPGDFPERPKDKGVA
jgi:hypothetical protein